MFSEWKRKQDGVVGLDAVKSRLIEALRDLDKTPKENVKAAIDTQLGLGKTKKGKQRKQKLTTPGAELAAAVDKVAGAKQKATYNADNDTSLDARTAAILGKPPAKTGLDLAPDASLAGGERQTQAPVVSLKKPSGDMASETPPDALSGLAKSVNTSLGGKRPDMAGRSVGVNRNENAVVEAIHLMQNEGMIDGDELRDVLREKHYQFQDAQGGAIGDPYDDKRATAGVNSAVNTAKLMHQHFNNGMPKPITGGVFGSQFTDVPDENRTGIYDYLMSNLASSLGKNRLGARREGARRDYNDEEYRKEGNKILKELIVDDRDSGSKPKDLFTPADVYLANAEAEPSIIRDFEVIQKMFDSGDIDEKQMLKSFTHMLQKKHQQRDLVGYSLKELSDGASGKITEANTSADDLTQAVSSVINGDVQLPMSFNPKTTKGQTRLTGNRNFTFNMLLKMMQDGEEVDMDDIKFASSSAVRPSKAKVEPFGAKPDTGTRQKLGETPIDMLRNLVKEYSGEELDDNINYVSGDKRETILQSDNYSEEQIGQWGDLVQDLADNPSQRFDINKSNIGINGEEMAPGDFIRAALKNFNFSDEERNSQEQYVDRGGQQYDRVESRFDTHSMLRNIRIFKALRNADKDGKLHDLLGGMVFNAQRLNTSEDSPFFPFAKIAN